MALFELRTLGSLDLRATDGRVIHSLLAQPKRLALLGYVCVATPRGMHRRDVLLATFWPESDREHARTSLRNALHILRRSLGEASVITRGDDEVSIASDAVWCDAVAFEEAIAAGRLEDALTLYRGALLAGFFIQDAPEFERWLERERARLHQLAVRAAGELAELRATGGDLTGALSAARRAVELAESDERALRRLLELLLQSGDRAGALEAYDAFARRLATDYQVEPSDATRGLIEEFRTAPAAAAGSRQPVASSAVTDVAVAVQAQQSATIVAPHVNGNSKRLLPSTRRAAVGILALAIMSLGTAMLLNGREGRVDIDNDVPLERRIAVLPFRSLSLAKEDEFLAFGLHDAILTQLSRIGDLHVISRQSVRAYDDTKKSIRRIAQELGVGTIVDASVQRVGDSVRVAVQVLDATNDRQLWADQYQRASSAIFSLENDVALAVAESLHVRTTRTERATLARPPTRNAEAYTFFLKGREYQLRFPGPTRLGTAFGRAELFAAEELFRRAIHADTAFALAHAALSAVHTEIYFLQYDRSPARREQILAEALGALRMQPGLPEGHLALGYYWYVGHQDYARALAEFEIARRGLPSDGQVQMFIANVYRRQGRWAEALSGHRRAFQLAPRESDKALNLARTYEALRRYEDAARTWDYAIAIEPTNYGFLIDRGRVFVKWQGALDSLEATLDRIPGDIDLGGRATIERVELALFRRRPLDALATLAAARRELFASNDAITMSLLRVRRGQARSMLGELEKAKLDYDTARVILERAIEATEKAGGDPHHLYADLGLVYAALGRKADAIKAAQQARELLPEAKDAWDGTMLLDHSAEVLVRVGDKDAALALIERLVRVPAGMSVQDLRLNPRWDALRSDPRFQELLTKYAKR